MTRSCYLKYSDMSSPSSQEKTAFDSSFNPSSIVIRGLIVAVLPALTLASLALDATLYGKKAGSRVWFTGAGFLYSTILAIKPTSYFVILPMLILL